MKKYILRFLLILWACGYYSCSDPGLVVPDEETSITGKALYFSPSYLEVPGSSNFTIDIHISEDIVDLIGAEIEFTYDKTLVSFHSAKIGLLLESAIENVLIVPIVFTEFENMFFLKRYDEYSEVWFLTSFYLWLQLFDVD